MKFLITVLPRPVPMPPEQGAALNQAALDWINERLEDGRMDCCYVFTNGGGVAITNAETHEEVFEEIMAYPLYPFYSFDVKPLCDVGHTMSSVIQAYSGAGG